MTAAPTDMLTTRMLCVALLRIAHSSARMTSLMTPRPSASSTFRLTMCAPGAMPGARPIRVVAVAGDDPGDVRAVPVVVVGNRVVVDEVDEGGDALAADGAHLGRVPL